MYTRGTLAFLRHLVEQVCFLLKLLYYVVVSSTSRYINFEMSTYGRLNGPSEIPKVKR